jgi:hypothetical protein
MGAARAMNKAHSVSWDAKMQLFHLHSVLIQRTPIQICYLTAISINRTFSSLLCALHSLRNTHCVLSRKYNYPVNKSTWCTIFFLVYLCLSVSTRFGLLWAHHQEIQLCLCDTWCSFFCTDDRLVCTLHTRQSSIPKNKYQVSHKYSCFSWWRENSCPKHVEKRNKHNKKNCAPSWFTRLHRNAWPTKHTITLACFNIIIIMLGLGK